MRLLPSASVSALAAATSSCGSSLEPRIGPMAEATASWPGASRATAPGSVRSPVVTVRFGFDRSPAGPWRVAPVTWWPRPSSSVAIWLPMAPLAPNNRTFIDGLLRDGGGWVERSDPARGGGAVALLRAVQVERADALAGGERGLVEQFGGDD